jgi:hypothetical protein
MKTITYILLILALFGFCSCTREKETFCTTEFRTITITVSGDNLDSYYTIRQSTGDTIRIARSISQGEKVYPVFDDSYQKTIEDKTESFTFQGIINGIVVVSEPFVIKADKCHIEYVSGRRSI